MCQGGYREHKGCIRTAVTTGREQPRLNGTIACKRRPEKFPVSGGGPDNRRTITGARISQTPLVPSAFFADRQTVDFISCFSSDFNIAPFEIYMCFIRSTCYRLQFRETFSL